MYNEIEREKEEEKKRTKIRMSHEHKNTTYCATEPIQTILNDRPKYGIAKK